ncbi:MAG: hypothetical protein GXN93_01960 [Candidatus Diapherotrites archaeon]|nr:hypothetical protein [Candidatus Diapherotrites archaeon]
MRKFYDLVAMDAADNWAKRLGFSKIYTRSEWKYVEKRKDISENVIPVVRAEDIGTIKAAGWAMDAIIDVRTKMDMQAAHLMHKWGQRAMYTLDWIRERPENLRFAAKGIRILHKARVPVLLATGAKDVACMKAPRDIAALGVLMGMSIPMAYAAVSTNWEGLL